MDLVVGILGGLEASMMVSLAVQLVPDPQVSQLGSWLSGGLSDGMNEQLTPQKMIE